LRCLAFAAFTILFSVTLISAQDHSKVDVFGGYSYLNADINDLGSRKSANGWEAAASGNFNKWLAAEFDVSGYYRTETLDLTPVGLGTVDIKLKDYSYVAGPRLNFKPIFVHALLGGDHLSASTQGFSRSQDSFAGAFGGGVQWKIAGPWSIRASGDYVFTRHNILGGPQSFTQNNVRASAGIVYSFGGILRDTASHRASTSSVSVQARASMPIPSLGIMAASRQEGGAEIVEVAPQSVAALANLHPGDVITSVEGKPVNTPMELAADLQNRAPGSQIHIGYLFHASVGAYAAQTVLILGGNK
jgi:opacity protein-like surface antigen